MARKNFSEEFRRQAVDLYQSTPGVTLKEIAGDLGIHEGTLSAWVKAAGGTVRDSHAPRPDTSRPAGAETPAQELARLRARVSELEAEKVRLNTEREILRRAAKYFAGETHW